MSVYFATVGDYLKIGYSKDPVGRVGSVTRLGTRPADVPLNADAHLVGWIPGDRSREAELHGQFADTRVAGEWFRLTYDDVRDLIWDDPRGVDMDRMSARAVFAADKYPEATRDDIAAAGIQVLATPVSEAVQWMGSL